jgi:hypothetical protein
MKNKRRKEMEDINRIKVYKVGLVVYDEKELKKLIENAKKDDRTKDIVYIKHDKDKDENGDLKKEHFHLLLNFSRGPITFRTVKEKILNVDDDRYVQILSKSWQKNLQYLIHKNNDNKYKYPLDDIVIERGDKNKIINLIINDTPINKKKYLDDLKELVMNRELTNELEIENWTIENFGSSNLYLENFQKITTYLKAIYESDKFIDSNKNLLGVAYIQGVSGVGKSTLAKNMCNNFIEKTGSTGIFEGGAGSSDVLDGYSGQNALILNDVRSEIMLNLGSTNILNLLDWHSGTIIHSRYKNINTSSIRFIVFTSTESLESIFNTFDGEEQKQFFRRIKTKIIMDEEKINVYEYNEKYNIYEFIKTIRNKFNRRCMEKKFGKTKNITLELI